jgi:tetratricopeptide (TPR) repeat protein
VPEKITAYRVFIASPGGLEEEREAFRRAVNAHNESDAIERRVIFLPIGWEITPGGIGRPQAIINEEVRRCDYFMLVLHDRWGSAPQAGKGPYSSGSEEEFDIARECCKLGSMRQIVILFKDLDPAQQRDPGPQLENVLRFREHLEAERSFLFEVFDELTNFEGRLRKHLAGWVRDHERQERGQAPLGVVPLAAADRRSVGEPAIRLPRDSGSAAVRDASALAVAGHVSQAERALAQVMAIDKESEPNDENFEAMLRYGDLQLQKESHAKAEEVFKQLLETARERGASDWEVAALSDLGRLYQAMRQPAEAEANYREALAIREQTLEADDPRVAVSLNALAEFLATQFRFREAEPLLRRALEIQQVSIAS